MNNTDNAARTGEVAQRRSPHEQIRFLQGHNLSLIKQHEADKATIAALVEALEEMLAARDYADTNPLGVNHESLARKKARAALALAKGGRK